MAAGSRGITLLIWIIVFTVLCTISLLLRLWAAIITRRKFFADDGMVLFAYANTVTLGGVCAWAIFNGLGKHTNELSQYEFGVQFKLLLSSGVTWLLGTVFVKLSVLWLYTRIFITAQFKRWARVLIVVVACYGLAFLILFMTRCQPVSQQWNPVPGGWCRDVTIDELTSVILNIVIDIAIVVLPMPVLWGLKMAVRTKIAVTVMFSIGFLTIGIMIWRLQATIEASKNPDFVYELATIGLISLMELWLGIIVASIPTLAPLLQVYVKPALSKLSNPSAEAGKFPLKNVHTIGGSSQGSRRPRNIYSQLDGDTSTGDLEEGRLTSTVLVDTKFKFTVRGDSPQDGDGHIYIQRDVKVINS